MNIVEGNLLHSVTHGVILQQVNAQNAMGSGFAKAVYEMWPEVKRRFHAWSGTFATDLERMGKIGTIEVEPGLHVINIVGQRFAGHSNKRYTSYDALDDGLQMVSSWLRMKSIPTSMVHVPLIGAGLGGGHWPIIEQIIEHRLGSDVTLWVLPAS